MRLFNAAAGIICTDQMYVTLFSEHTSSRFHRHPRDKQDADVFDGGSKYSWAFGKVSAALFSSNGLPASRHLSVISPWLHICCKMHPLCEQTC